MSYWVKSNGYKYCYLNYVMSMENIRVMMDDFMIVKRLLTLKWLLF